MVALEAPSGQNQMNGMLFKQFDLRDNDNNRSNMLSTEESTGQLGNDRFFQPLKWTLCRRLRTPMGRSGRMQ